ncbi:calcium-binding protein [Oceanicella sp. SM1341]|uniref:calcium-binding protein n=1 Tax=Oceanicella sp. SM1341 TaxID=1548889 RepID=UPI000E548F2D|nr:calcium-binding protein [Oceanicella sp. SM1341]
MTHASASVEVDDIWGGATRLPAVPGERFDRYEAHLTMADLPADAMSGPARLTLDFSDNLGLGHKELSTELLIDGRSFGDLGFESFRTENRLAILELPGAEMARILADDALTITLHTRGGYLHNAPIRLTATLTHTGILAGDDAFTFPGLGTRSGNLLADNGSGADEFDPLQGRPLVTHVNGIPVGDGITIELPGSGTLTVEPGGRFVYRPDLLDESLPASQQAEAHFTYTIANADGASEGEVVLHTQGVDDDDIFYGGRDGNVIRAGEGNDTVYGNTDWDRYSTYYYHETIHGEAGSDTIFGLYGNDFIFGGEGDDRLFNADGYDEGYVLYEGGARLYGGAGNDLLVGEDSTLYGGEGEDVLMGSGTLHGGAGDDELQLSDEHWLVLAYGGDGNDRILSAGGSAGTAFGGAGDDVMIVTGHEDPDADSGSSTLYGGDGADIIRSEDSMLMRGGADDDVIADVSGFDGVRLLGDGGNDTLRMGSGAGFAYGGLGDDRIFGGAGKGRLFGDEGDDAIQGGAGDEQIYGGDGADHLVDRQGIARLYGGAGDDILQAGHAGGSLFGGIGHDRLMSGRGDDLVEGGDGNDRIHDTGGLDRIFGGAGNDLINAAGIGGDMIGGGDGNDRVYGGSDHDTIDGGAGGDMLFGNAGLDTITGGAGADMLDGGIGSDLLRGGDDDDRLDGGSDHDTLHGDAGDDLLLGEGGEDTLFGGEGADRLHGGSGDDRLYGGAGSDLLSGGPGIDLIEGGAGADIFAFARLDGVARVTDFELGTDILRISGFGAAMDSYAELATIATQSGADAVFDFATGEQLTLENVGLAELGAGSVVFV